MNINRKSEDPAKDLQHKEDKAQDVRLWVALQQAANFMLDVREKDVARFGVTNMESAILNAVHEIGYESTPVRITRRISILKQHSVSEVLNAMEKKGLVTKHNDLPRKNLVRIELTQKGLESLKMVSTRESILRMFAALSKREKKQLEPILDKLVKEALKERLMAPLLYQKETEESVSEPY
jgi:DNA-binding MarR family transcriptional regulator